MNKIYKVIWSKVKNQYVVVSELAHSSGKQSRTSRSSIRSRIAALVVCGAIAAFGVLPMNSAFAAEPSENTGNTNTGATIIDNNWMGYDSTKYSIEGQNGITIGQTPAYSDDKKNYTITIGLNTGTGLKTENGEVVIDLATGIGTGTNTSSNVSGLEFKNGQLKVATGAGLKIDNDGKVALNVDTSDNSGLTAGDNGLAVKLAKSGDKDISGLTADSDGLKLNIDENGFEIDENGQLKNKAVMYEAGTEKDLAVGKLTANNDVVTLDNNGATKYSLNTIGDKTQGITSYNADTETTTVNGTLSASDVVAGDYGLKAIGDKTKGITYNAENKTTTVDGILSATTISGLNNKDWNANDSSIQNSTKAATEAQLYKATQLNVKYDVGDKSSVTLGGSTYQKGKDATGTRLTNVAYANLDDTSSGSDAVNVDLLKDYVAQKAGSTNLEAGTNIEVKDGVVSLKPNVTLDAKTEDGNKIDLNGTKGTISAVNTTKSEPQYGWDGIKTTTTTNTFDFSNGGKFVTEKNENTVVKNLIRKITSERDLVTTNTTEFNEKGATFSKVETDQGWKKKFPFGEDTWDTTTNSSTNIDGGTITLSSNTRGENKVVIDGTTGEMTGLSNTTWNAEKAANGKYESSTKAATEAQLQGVYNTAEDAYDTAKDAYDEAGKHTTVKLSDKNLTLEERPNAAGGTEYTLGLNSVVTLNGDKPDGDGIVLNGESGSIHAVNTQAAGIVGPFGEHIGGVATNKFDFDNDGAKFETKVSGTIGDGIGNSGTLTATKTTKFDENGATFINKKEAKGTIFGIPAGKYTDVSFTNIDGGIVTTDIVKGLNNTEWNKGIAKAVAEKDELKGVAATQGQLKDVYTEASKHTTVGLADEDGNLTLVEEDTDNGKVYTLGLKDILNVTSVTAGNTTLDSNGLTITGTNGNTTLANDGLTIAGTKYVSLTGLDAGNKVISNVANGEADADAVNVSQLNSKTGNLDYSSNKYVTDNDNLTTAVGKLDNAIQKTSATANKGWTAKVGNKDIDVKPGDTLQFKGDNNITVTANDRNDSINVELNPVVTLDGTKYDGDGIVLNGYDGTISAVNTDKNILGNKTTTNTFKFDNGGKFVTKKVEDNTNWVGEGTVTTTINTSQFDENGATFINNKKEETSQWKMGRFGPYLSHDEKTENSSTNIDGGTIKISSDARKDGKDIVIDGTAGEMSGLSNTTWDAQNPNAYANSDKAATEAQLQKAAAASKTTVSAGDSNIKIVTETDDTDKHTNYKVSLDDNITLGENANAININGTNGTLKIGNGANAIKMDGVNGTLNIGSKFSVAEDGTVLSDGDVIANADGGEKYSLTKLGKYAVKYDETAFDNGTPTITLASGSDNKGTRIRNVADGLETKDAVNLGQLQSTEKHIATNVTANGETPEFNGAYAVGEDGKITLTEVNGAGKETGNKVVLSNIASMDALKAVEATASAGWTAIAGDNDAEIKVTPGSILNFEDDGNITVSGTKESNELKFGLNDNITLGDKAGQKTSTSLTLYTDPSPIKDKDGNYVLNKEEKTVTGYVPESYINDQGRVDDFVSTHGGFMMYATNTSGEGVFGITTDGMVHAKDVISYMPNSDPNSKDKILKYSLNDIGDIVTQIAHGQYDKTGMEYTLISDFSSQADKDKPFQAEDGNRTIGLAVRQDGAVVVGAIVDEEGKLAESGIRINDDTNAGGGKDTITGLSNTTWTPPTNNSMARTNGDTRIDSMAATLGQLDDLYDSVVGYNVDENGSVNPNHVTLKGEEKYTFTTDANGTKTYSGGVKLDNVAYAVTDTTSKEYNGSAAVNVDLLKDTIAGVKAETNTDVGDRNYEGVTSKDPITNEDNVTEAIGKLDNRVGDLNYNSVDGTKIDNGDDVTTAIGKLDNRIDSIGGTATSADNDTITGGKIDAEKGTISLTQKDKGTITLEGQFTNSVVDSAELKDGTLTITSKDQYSGDTSSVKVEGLASTEVVGAKNKEDLATAYKDADKDGNATTEYITDSETMVDADIALDHAVQDLASNDQYLNSRIDSVEKRLGDVEQRIDKVGAMAAAIANLRTMGFDPEAPTEIAVGVGQYKSETGLAIGVFHYPNQDFMLSASLSTSGDEVMGGIGATWRIGRKTAAEKAKDEEKRILAKAEEIKQAAKRAEVKAQADRHAKLLAEREAKGESIRPIENKVEQTQEQA